MKIPEKLDPKVIASQMQIVNECIGAWKFQIISVCQRLGIYELLSKGPLHLRTLAEKTKAPEPSLERLLNAAVAIKILDKKDGRYHNGALVRDTLISDAQGYLGNWMNLMSLWYTTFAKLETAIRRDESVVDINCGENPDAVRLFIRGMIDYASYRGTDILNYIDLKGKKHLLDIGGGPAIYSIIFCKQYQELVCTNFDFPMALEVADELIQKEGLQDRIRLRPGNYTIDSFGEGYDVVFLSHVLHQEDAATCSKILTKAFGALTSGGTIIVQAMFPSEEKTLPIFQVLHDLLCLLIFPRGKNHSVAETSVWLEEARFVEIVHKPLSMFNENSIIVAKKP
jgi:hypothetical protein